LGERALRNKDFNAQGLLLESLVQMDQFQELLPQILVIMLKLTQSLAQHTQTQGQMQHQVPINSVHGYVASTGNRNGCGLIDECIPKENRLLPIEWCPHPEGQSIWDIKQRLNHNKWDYTSTAQTVKHKNTIETSMLESPHIHFLFAPQLEKIPRAPLGQNTLGHMGILPDIDNFTSQGSGG